MNELTNTLRRLAVIAMPLAVFVATTAPRIHLK